MYHLVSSGLNMVPIGVCLDGGYEIFRHCQIEYWFCTLEDVWSNYPKGLIIVAYVGAFW